MDISCNFHYVDEDGNNTVPDKATRITLLVYDEFHKISKRVDWKRDDANIYEDCSLLLEKNLRQSYCRNQILVGAKKKREYN